MPEIKWEVDIKTGCWDWLLYRDRSGYGRLTADATRGVLAHRWSYMQHVGPIPEGFDLDHLCRNKGCVNPAHLEAVTRAEHAIRGIAATKTYCKSGHKFDDMNTYQRPRDGQRQCRACNHAAVNRYRAKRSAA